MKKKQRKTKMETEKRLKRYRRHCLQEMSRK